METSFPDAYLHATLLVSLLSVWVLVGLFAYLNRYTRRDYFSIWTAAWLSYALWLTLGLTWDDPTPGSWSMVVRQCCVAISAAFLLWGTLSFVGIKVRQTLFGLFMLFLVLWTAFMPEIATNPLQIQLPVFILLGSGSAFAGVCFYRLRRRLPYVGAGMLSLGFFLWGVYLGSYPVTAGYPDLFAVGYLVAATLQLFIAVSMIVLVLEEVRHKTESMVRELGEIRSERETLQAKVMSREDEVRRMYDQVRLAEGVQQAYDELRRTQKTVVQQERLRALGQMASGIAHNINNALCPITAYTEVLEKTAPELKPQHHQFLRNIAQAARDIAQIVDRMREFYRSRSKSEELAPIDVNNAIRELVELTRPRWRDQPQKQGIQVDVQCQLQPDLPSIAGDPTELREALTNLVFNAVDALPQGGIITLVSRVEQAPPTNDGPSPRHLVIEVRDNGVGMDKKTLARCLEPFFTTKAQRGTGLGLAMVYGMMQRHEGSLGVESEPGQGTVVRLSFPVPDKIQAVPAVASGSLSSPNALRLLCVDDDPSVRSLLTDCLAACGHLVEVAEDGPSGLDAFRRARDESRPFDGVITDLGMPGMDGHHLARELKALSPKTPVVMLTGWGQAEEEQPSPSAVDAIVSKPPRISQLNSLVLKLTARETVPV
jgi:signal transduction histidine kinase/CheY-like chemotaxis protein